MNIVIAAQTGTVVLDGGRRIVRKGVTTAHAGHELVTRYPHLWRPIQPDYPVGPADAAYADAVAGAGLPFAEALRALAQGLAERGYDIEVDGDAPITPTAVVEYALHVIDQWGGGSPEPEQDDQVEITTLADADPVYMPVEPDVAAPAAGGQVDRAAVRAWAAEQGIEVSSHGKIPGAVLDQYRAAHDGS